MHPIRRRLPPFLLSAVLGALFVLVSGRAAQAEESQDNGEYEVVRWTTNEGLPSNVVRALAQTPDGFLWIGTWGGLARFDGVEFKVFDLTNAPELGTVSISALAVDAHGDLWIASHQGVICRCRKGHFERMGAPLGPPFSAMMVDANGAVWAGGRQLVRFVDGERDLVLNVGVKGMQPDSNGAIWVANWQGVHKVEGGTVARLEGPSKDLGRVYGISRRADGTFLAHGARSQVPLPENRVLLSPPPSVRGPGVLWSSRLDHLGGSWWGTNRGLFRLPPWRTQREQRDRTSPISTAALRVLPFEQTGQVRAILEDRERRIWIGSEGKGLLLLRPIVTRALEGRVASVVPMPDGTLWTTRLPGRIPIHETRAGLVTRRLPRFRNAHLSPARDGGIWIAHEEGYAHLRGDTIEEHAIPPGRRAPRRPLFEDSRGRLWWREALKESACIENGRVTAVVPGRIWHEGKDGGLLVCRSEEGPGWLRDGQVVTLGASGAPRRHIRSIIEDEDGRIWISTAGAGLLCVHEGRTFALTQRHGLPHNVIGKILKDDHRRLWINSNAGLFVATLDDLTAVVEGRRPLAPCRQITRAEMGSLPSAMSAQGHLYVHSIEGYVEIDTRALPPLPTAPVAHIEHVRVGDKKLEGVFRAELEPDERSVRVAYTAPYLAHGDLLQFRHRLLGVDPDWVMAGTRRVAYYANLSPGSYTFAVMARDPGGHWGQAALVSIDVPPEFHETLWALGALAFVLFGVVFLLYHNRTRSLTATRRALLAEEDMHRAERSARHIAGRLVHAQEEERKRIALELHDDVSQRLALLSLGIETETMQREELVALTREVSSDIHRLSRALHPARLEHLGLIPAIRGLGRESAECGGLLFTFESSGDPTGIQETSALCLYRITQEALSNVLRHSGAKRLRIHLERIGDNVHLEISDDGTGFRPEAVQGTGLGLPGMAERVAAVGGSYRVDSNVDEGTKIRVQVPMRGTRA